jgi:hypothetical protein
MGTTNRTKKALALIVLFVGASLTDTSLADRACTFVREFDSSAKSSQRVSFHERIVHSLIEAASHGNDCAPGV